MVIPTIYNSYLFLWINLKLKHFNNHLYANLCFANPLALNFCQQLKSIFQ